MFRCVCGFRVCRLRAVSGVGGLRGFEDIGFTVMQRQVIVRTLSLLDI